METGIVKRSFLYIRRIAPLTCALIALVLLVYWGATRPLWHQGPFRDQLARGSEGAGSQTASHCLDNEVIIKAPFRPEPDGSVPGELRRCAIQSYRLDVQDGSTIRPVRFDYAFLEVDALGELLAPVQKTALVDRISALKRSGKSVYLVFFVHGWRNSASPEAGDPTRFRTMLGYISSAIHQRCGGAAQPTCSPAVLGIYIGWPGRRIWELDSNSGKAALANSINNLLAAPTFVEVAGTSDRIGSKVVHQISELVQAGAASGNSPPARSLVLAHSAGGNVLMSGLAGPMGQFDQSMLAQSIRTYNTQRLNQGLPNPRKASFDVQQVSPLGDMVVLFNPASPARRWVSLQQFSYVDSESGQLLPATTDPKAMTDRKKLTADHLRYLQFPANQRPTLISFTAPCEWRVDRRDCTACSKSKQNPDQCVSKPCANECDEATYRYFNLYRRSVALLDPPSRDDPVRGIALGHFTSFDPLSSLPKTKDGQSRIWGASHEVTSSSGSGGLREDTGLSSLLNARSSECLQLPNPWLQEARGENVSGRANQQPRSSGHWDTLREAHVRLKSNSADPMMSDALSIQSRFKVSIGRKNKEGVESWGRSNTRVDVDSNTPFWNMRADSTAMYNHGVFYSYPLICHVVQLWLDPIVSSGSP